MRQVHICHPTGTFAACAVCRHEPKHFEVHGRTSGEPCDFRPVPVRHLLECQHPCKRRTHLHASLAHAVNEWGALGETLPLPLVVKPVGNVRALRPRQRGRARA